MKSGNLNFLEPSGLLQACNGTALPLPLPDINIWHYHVWFCYYCSDFLDCWTALIWIFRQHNPSKRSKPLTERRSITYSTRIFDSGNFANTSQMLKGLPQQAEVALGFPGRLRPRIFLTFGTTRVVGLQPYALAAFTPEEIPGTHFQRLSRPQGTWFCP